MSIGLRLKEEREKLGLNQEKKKDKPLKTKL